MPPMNPLIQAAKASASPAIKSPPPADDDHDDPLRQSASDLFAKRAKPSSPARASGIRSSLHGGLARPSVRASTEQLGSIFAFLEGVEEGDQALLEEAAEPSP